jgi:hypothetical protein
MYNIKLSDETLGFRTVILKKSRVEVNGENKEIIMIRDVSAKYELE